MKSKILVSTSSFNVSNNEGLDKLKACGFDIIFNPFKRRLKEDEVKYLLSDNVVAIIAGLEPLKFDVLRSAKSLKFISRCGVGLDNVDLKACNEMGINVSSTPDAPTVPVAELTISLILTLLRRTHESNKLLLDGQWSPLMGRLLKGKKVGILGLGRIGLKVANFLNVFDVQLIAYDPYVNECPDYITLTTFDDVISLSDVVSLHLPLTDNTRNIICKDSLSLMKSGACIINTSRGGLIDEAALYEALENKLISSAALDVFDSEPYNGPLKNLSNIFILPHMGSYAEEARHLMEIEAASNLVRDMRLGVD